MIKVTIPLTTELSSYMLTITTTSNLSHLTVLDTGVLFGGTNLHEKRFSNISDRNIGFGFTGGSVFKITSPDDFETLSLGENLEIHLLSKYNFIYFNN